MKRFLLFFSLMCALAAPASAQLFGKPDLGVVMSAQEAHQKALAGELVLVDVRSSGEWKETGVPASGYAITMHQKPDQFTSKLKEAMDGDPTKQLAVICAVGSRTTYLQKALKKLGFPNPINVAEGMIGGRYGTGWIKSGLPIRQWGSASDQAPKPQGQKP